MKRRDFAFLAATTGALQTMPLAALSQSKKDSVILAMTLEPPGLDPTAGAASAIAEITHYNIFETLTKINSPFSPTKNQRQIKQQIKRCHVTN
jgi:peptide/nickel transport system substrate-binding protein